MAPDDSAQQSVVELPEQELRSSPPSTVNTDAGTANPTFFLSDSGPTIYNSSAMEFEDEPTVHRRGPFLTGWRLHLLTLSISLCMFMVNMEVSVIGTSLVSILDELHGFNQSGWLITGYLITYTSMIIIWSKLSDEIGRKCCLVTTITFFVAFSGGCGAAQNLTQLIICRAFQGVGAAGCVSLGLTIAYEMIPMSKYPTYAAIISASVAFGSLVGPLIGGGFSEHITWRWVFLINLPVGAILLPLVVLSIPDNFPYHQNFGPLSIGRTGIHPRAVFSRVDFAGAALLLAGSLMLVTVLLEGGVQFEWHSAAVICLFVLSGAMGLMFLVNEWLISKPKYHQQPMFPWRFLSNRVWMGTLLTTFLSAIPYNVVVVDMPQRFQIVDGLSPFTAGLRLIPFNFCISLGSVGANLIAGKTKIAPIYFLFIGAVMEAIGTGLLATVPSSGGVPHSVYGYEVLAGLGLGIMFGITFVIPPHVVDPEDTAVASGALLQFRVFGGALGIAISQAVLNNQLSRNLPLLLPNIDTGAIKSVEFIHKLPTGVREAVQEVFADGYNLELKIVAGCAAAQLFTVLMLWRTGNQISITPDKEVEVEGEEEEVIQEIGAGALTPISEASHAKPADNHKADSRTV